MLSQKPVGLAGISVGTKKINDNRTNKGWSQKPVGLAGISVVEKKDVIKCTRLKSQKPVGLAGISVLLQHAIR